VTTHALSGLLPILEVVAVVLGCFYAAIIATVVWFLIDGRLATRRDRRVLKEHDELARRFRSELDRADAVDFAEELRRGRAA
jgi:hypothetical protein